MQKFLLEYLNICYIEYVSFIFVLLIALFRMNYINLCVYIIWYNNILHLVHKIYKKYIYFTYNKNFDYLFQKKKIDFQVVIVLTTKVVIRIVTKYKRYILNIKDIYIFNSSTHLLQYSLNLHGDMKFRICLFKL